MPQGQETPKVTRDFILKTKQNAPGLTHQQISDKVEEKFGTRIDKSTVGKIIQRADVSNSLSNATSSILKSSILGRRPPSVL